MSKLKTLADDFQKDGAVVVRALLSADQLALARRGAEENLARPSPRALQASPAGDPGRFFEDFRNWTRIEAYRSLIEDGAIAETAAALMGSATARFHHDHLLIKEPGTRQATPWHQDQPYYDFEGRQTVSFWIALDPVPLESSLRFVAGSHLGPWLMPRTFMTQESRWFPEGSLQELPDIDGHPEAHRILGWSLEPGDAIAFHMLALHSARGATSRRRALSLRWIGDDVTYAPRPWTTSPDFPELKGVIEPGAPMDHPLFPAFWPREPARTAGLP